MTSFKQSISACVEVILADFITVGDLIKEQTVFHVSGDHMYDVRPTETVQDEKR